MSRRPRENAIWVAMAVAGMATSAWLTLSEYGWNDYDNEARPAVSALVHGHLSAFFQLAPSYGASLLERAPFALAPGLWGGGELAVYRMLALPCMLAGAALGLWLVAWMRRSGRSPLARALALMLCVANPLTLLALEIGHPDELLGGALCVGAVLLAARGRGILAALALGAAIANKQWALVAVGPVLIALPARRMLCAALAASVSAVLFAPFMLLGTARFVSGVHGAATSTGGVFQPWQIWWFLGRHVYRAAGIAGGAAHELVRTPPTWLQAASHPLIIAIALPLSLAAWVRLRAAHQQGSHGARPGSHGTAGERRGLFEPSPALSGALLLLALLLLLRCMLDPWDNIYYPIPFVLALLTWETFVSQRPALLALGATLAVWTGHHWLGVLTSPDVQAAFFAAWSVPLALGLGVALSAHGRQLLGQPRQDLVSLLGDDHQVLDPHAQPAG